MWAARGTADLTRSLVALAVCALAASGCAPSTDRQLADLFGSATLDLRRGELVEAQALAGRGIALAQPASEWAWAFRLLHAEIAINRNAFEAALPALGETLPAEDRFAALTSRQRYLNARLALARGKLNEALPLFERARETAAPKSDIRIDIDIFRGQVQLRLGRWADGESTLNSVVAETTAANDRYRQALALNALGMGRVVRNRFDEALPWFERILAMTDLEPFTLYSKALYNAGDCYAKLGQFERAATLQRRAIAVYERRGTSQEREQALGELGNTYVLQGNTREGLPYLRQAFDVATAAHLDEDAALWAGNLSVAHSALGEWKDAERFNSEARRLRVALGRGRLVYNTLHDAQIAVGLDKPDEARRLFLDALDGAADVPAVEWEAHAGLASLAVAARQPAVAAQHFEAALDTIEKTRSDLLKSDYKFSYLSRLIHFYQQYVDALVDNNQSARALEIADSSRGRVLAEKQGGPVPARASAARFRGIAAQSNTIVLSYWLTPVRSHLWVVSATGVQYLPLPPAPEIEQLVRRHQALIANALADPLASADTAGDALYRLLVAPIAHAIPRDSTVILVVDGALHGLNFETLPVDGPRRHYWIEDVEIQVAPSLGSLTLEATRRSGPASLLAIGNPTPRPPDFPALGYASAEMDAIARHFTIDRVTRIENDHASPTGYLAARPDQFAFVHFTAHATANVESPLDSAVILSGPDSAYKLYARDVANQPLHAELVTVSACRSAGERAYSGEGLVGFAWAFLRAGSERVIAGLWDVDDRSTAAFMDRLYADIATGLSPAHALRRAKLAQLSAGGPLAKPYYWAPFELFTVVLSPNAGGSAPTGMHHEEPNRTKNTRSQSSLR